MEMIRKYVWVVNTLRRGRRLTLNELSDRWQRLDGFCGAEPLSRQTFYRWRESIAGLFGIEIECESGGAHRYYIKNPEALDGHGLSQWLLDTYDTVNTLSAGLALRDRILVEDVPSSHGFLEDIIAAMKANSAIDITHQGFGCGQATVSRVEPYCVRAFHRRWYLLARRTADSQMRLYGLDRITDVTQADGTFRLPESFDAREFFAPYFGIVVNDDEPVQRIVLRAYRYHQHYLRSLPLHHSQREIYTSDEYADFELTLRPNYDFCLELLSKGAMIEVMEPQSLRTTMQGWTHDLWALYNNK